MKTYKPVSIWYVLYALSAFFIIILFLLSSVGCTSTRYTRSDETGEKISFSSSSLFSKRAIKDVDYGVTRNGSRRFRLKGYASDQTENMTQAIEAALRAYQNQQRTPAIEP